MDPIHKSKCTKIVIKSKKKKKTLKIFKVTNKEKKKFTSYDENHEIEHS